MNPSEASPPSLLPTLVGLIGIQKTLQTLTVDSNGDRGFRRRLYGATVSFCAIRWNSILTLWTYCFGIFALFHGTHLRTDWRKSLDFLIWFGGITSSGAFQWVDADQGITNRICKDALDWQTERPGRPGTARVNEEWQEASTTLVRRA